VGTGHGVSRGPAAVVRTGPPPQGGWVPPGLGAEGAAGERGHRKRKGNLSTDSKRIWAAAHGQGGGALHGQGGGAVGCGAGGWEAHAVAAHPHGDTSGVNQTQARSPPPPVLGLTVNDQEVGRVLWVGGLGEGVHDHLVRPAVLQLQGSDLQREPGGVEEQPAAEPGQVVGVEPVLPGLGLGDVGLPVPPDDPRDVRRGGERGREGHGLALQPSQHLQAAAEAQTWKAPGAPSWSEGDQSDGHRRGEDGLHPPTPPKKRPTPKHP